MAQVTLYVYDLSNGMARMMSQQLLGRQIDGVWHTSVVVFGREYYYGQGIFIDHPGQTHHGAPLQEIPMGTTHIPEEVFVEFIAQMRQIWTGDRYHLLDNNCNNFSSEVCKFLVGKAIPSQIEGLPAEVMNTPFGAALRPMIEGMFGGSAVPSNNNNNSGYPLTSTFSSQPSNIPSCIISISNLQELQHRLKLHRLVAIDFTSTSCPPCRIISPEFERLVEERQIYNGKSSDLVGLKVDVGIGRDAASFFKVTATPTFMFYLDGVKTAEFKGAQVGELKSNLDLLLFTAYPPHPHCKISIPTLSSYPQVPIAFNASASLDKIFIKLDENCSQSGLPGLRDGIKEAVKEKSELPSNWHQEVIPLLKQLPLALIFPLIDVVRIMALSNNVVNFFQKETPSSMMAHLNRCVSEQKSLQKATALMSLRLACNFFRTDTILETFLLSESPSSDSASNRSITTAFLIETLLSSDTAVRCEAASLAFNVSIYIQNQKPQKNDSFEEWVVEILASLIKAFELATEVETVLRLLVAIGNIIHNADENLILMAKNLDLPMHLSKKPTQVTSSYDIEKIVKLKSLCNELTLLTS